MGGFQFDHLRSPPAGSEKIFTNSSAFSFLLSASTVRSWSILSASTFFDFVSFARNFSAISCCSVAIWTPVDLSSLSLTTANVHALMTPWHPSSSRGAGSRLVTAEHDHHYAGGIF